MKVLSKLGLYILDDNDQPVAERDTLAWGRWLEANRQRLPVADDSLPSGARVSTVFLAIDYDFHLTGVPLLWQSLTIGGPTHDAMARYATREEALAGHQKMLAAALEAMNNGH